MYAITWELWAMEAWRAPADGLTPTGQCRRFIVDREELQRRDIDRLHRRWRDTASQLTKQAAWRTAAGRRLVRDIVVEVDASTRGTLVV